MFNFTYLVPVLAHVVIAYIAGFVSVSKLIRIKGLFSAQSYNVLSGFLLMSRRLSNFKGSCILRHSHITSNYSPGGVQLSLYITSILNLFAYNQ